MISGQPFGAKGNQKARYKGRREIRSGAGCPSAFFFRLVGVCREGLSVGHIGVRDAAFSTIVLEKGSPGGATGDYVLDHTADLDFQASRHQPMRSLSRPPRKPETAPDPAKLNVPINQATRMVVLRRAR